MTEYARRPPSQFPPRVWAQARADYFDGMSAKRIEAKHGIRERTLYKRAQREGWKRADAWAAEAAALAEAGNAGVPEAPALAEAANDEPFVQPSPVQIVEVSLMRAIEALRRGNAAEATRLAEAGHKVGEFAELVKLVRAREA